MAFGSAGLMKVVFARLGAGAMGLGAGMGPDALVPACDGGRDPSGVGFRFWTTLSMACCKPETCGTGLSGGFAPASGRTPSRVGVAGGFSIVLLVHPLTQF